MNPYNEITFDEREKEQMGLCAFCPKLCRHLCPVSSAFTSEALIPGSKLTALKLLVEREIPPSQNLMEIMHACTGCRRCTAFCKHEVDVSGLLFKGRALLAREGFFHPKLTHIRTAFARAGNAHNQKTREILLEQIPEELRYDPSGEEETLLFFSADEILLNPGVVKSTLKLMNAFADRIYKVFTGPESCSGLPLLWAGGHEEFIDHARRMLAALGKASAIISPSSLFVAALRRVYSGKGFTAIPQVMHLSEYISKAVERQDERFKKYEGEVWYLDDPFLANYAGVTEEPRRLLKAICKNPIREFSRNRAEAFSLGEGFVSLTMPEEYSIMTAEMLEEVSDKKALVLLPSETAASALKAQKPPFKALNLFDFTAERLK